MTRLAISSPILFNAVHRVFDGLRPEVRARLAGQKLTLITDSAPPPPMDMAGVWGKCARWANGEQIIYLSPELEKCSPDDIEGTIRHEFSHACQSSFHGDAYDEWFANLHADDWAPPSRYPKIDWKQR